MFYGWKIGSLSLCGNMLLQGASIYCINAFLEPLCSTNGWSRSSLNFSLGIAALMGQIAMPLAAAISARYSLRLLMTLGALFGGIATCAMGFVDNIFFFTLLLIILWVSSQFCGGVVGNALMSNWFAHNRGVALGLANSGTTFAGLILPMGCLILISNYGLLFAYSFLGSITCILALLCWLYVRSRPQDVGLWPDGRRHAPHKFAVQHISLAWLPMLKRPAVWCIGIPFGLALMTGSGVMSQLKPRFFDLGLDEYTAMWLTCASALFGVGAKFFWGWICDKTTPVLASRLIMLASFASMLISLLPPSIWSMACFGFCYSSCIGGVWVVLPAVTAYYFGANNFLSVYKLISIFILLRCLGFPVMGLSWEIGSSYALADLIFILSLLLAFILTLFLHEKNAAEGKHRHHLKK